jgi:hypothetical protein
MFVDKAGAYPVEHLKAPALPTNIENIIYLLHKQPTLMWRSTALSSPLFLALPGIGKEISIPEL